MENVAIYEGLIEAARTGKRGAVLALRDFLCQSSATMPDMLVISISETVLEHMKETLRDQAEQN